MVEQLLPQHRHRRALVQKAAPGHVARIERLRLRQQLRPHRRAEAVGADQNVAAPRCAVGEVRRHACLVLRDAHEIPAQPIGGAARGAAEHLEQPVPGGGDLRAGVASDDAAGRVEHQPPGDRHPELPCHVEAQLGQRIAHLRMRHDPRAPARQWDGRALVHLDVPPALPQIEGREQPTDGAADDDGAARLRFHVDQPIDTRHPGSRGLGRGCPGPPANESGIFPRSRFGALLALSSHRSDRDDGSEA